MERGIGTSRGIGIGHVLVVSNNNAVVNRGTHYNANEEKARFFEARKIFMEQTESLLTDLEKKLGESDKDALVLKNQIYLVKDIQQKVRLSLQLRIITSVQRQHLKMYAISLLNCFLQWIILICSSVLQIFRI